MSVAHIGARRATPRTDGRPKLRLRLGPLEGSPGVARRVLRQLLLDGPVLHRPVVFGLALERLELHVERLVARREPRREVVRVQEPDGLLLLPRLQSAQELLLKQQRSGGLLDGGYRRVPTFL